MVLQLCMRLKKIWDRHGFVVLFITIVVFFLIYWFFETRYEQNGTYSMNYYYDPNFTSVKDIEKSSPRQHHKKKENNGCSKGELLCKQHLENRFQLPFIKCRPSFLYNEVTGENLELDLYNNDLKLAVEYNGRQHYEFVPFFHQTRDKFQTQKYRDRMKQELCAKQKIFLIIVPFTVPDQKIGSYIDERLGQLGFISSANAK